MPSLREELPYRQGGTPCPRKGSTFSSCYAKGHGRRRRLSQPGPGRAGGRDHRCRGLGPDRCRVRRTDSGPHNAPRRLPDTRLGYSFATMDLYIPKIREGSYSPALLEPRHRSERAQLFVVQQAFVEGVSTRSVDDLVNALGCDSISKSQGSRICRSWTRWWRAFSSDLWMTWSSSTSGWMPGHRRSGRQAASSR